MSQPRIPKHVPMRSCVGCRAVKPTRELIRLVYGTDGRVEVDRSGKKVGRGAYVCCSQDCWTKGVKKNRLEHVLKGQVASENVAELLQLGQKVWADDEGDSAR
ncbi:MAG: YlxR family protein [Chloroflexi bacterium]|nr:YlxR family protein [Chloroflexota bacterium]